MNLTRAAGLATLLIAVFGAPSSVLAAELTTVSGAQIGTSDNVTVVRISLSADGAKATVSPFRQTNPERLVLDIAGAKLAEGAAVPTGGIVSRAEYSTFNDGADNVRLTLYLDSQATYDVRGDGNAIVLTLTPGAVNDPLAEALGAVDPTGPRLSGPLAAQSGAAITSLDFEQKDRVSRVLIGVQAGPDSSGEPAISQPERDLIAIDIPGAKLPDSLKRELDTRFFYSAVDAVRANPTRAGTRITVRLREGAEYTVLRQGGVTILEIQVPADILAQKEAALQSNLQQSTPAAPATPATNGGKGLSNATGDETLISGKGKTVDPQSVFGQGAGSKGGGTFSFATDSRSASAQRSSGRRLSIDLQDAELATVFRFIADFADINIISSDDVSGRVTVRLKDVPWDEALGAVLQAKGLGAQQYGNILRVAPIETIKAEQQAALESKRAADDLEDLSVYVAPLNYAQADEVTEQVTAVLSPRGSVQVDTRGNQLIVRDGEDEIAQVRELLRQLDKPNRQVNIEARFVEANSTFTHALGIQWGGEVNASATTGYPTGAFFPNSIGASGGIAPVTGNQQLYSPGADNLLVDLGTAESSGALSFSLGSIPGLIDLDARLSALEREGWGKIVSNPHLQTLDNEEARVLQGARIPYTSVSNGGTQTQFIPAELELAVTPHITSEGTIFLDINMTNNRPDFSAAVGGQPSIQTKEIETRVLVPDGDTTVLGGVYATGESYQKERVPGLGSIPIIGYLFSSSSRERTQNEMLVFITPRIVPLDTAD